MRLQEYKESMKKKFVIHPFLIALFPVISLWVANLNYVTANMVIRSLILVVILSGLLFLLLHLMTHEWEKAGVITSLILLIILTYGHFYTVLRGVQLLSPIIRHRYLLPLVGVLVGFMIFLVLKNGKTVSPIASFMTVLGLVLVSISLTRLIVYQINVTSFDFKASQKISETSSSVQSDTPDIYYIILDAYGREDTLKEFYGYDNSEFIQALKQRGFYVAEKSNSNYMNTYYSLSSSLNMDYLDNYVSQNGGRMSSQFLSGLINNSKLREFLRSQGYKMVAFESSYENLSSADVFLKPREQKNLSGQSILAINEFEGMLIDTTIGKIWLDIFYNQQKTNEKSILMVPYLQHANRVTFALTELGNVAKMPGKKFVFAHVVSPHPPFIFSSNGDLIFPPRPYSLSDGDYFSGGEKEYISGYTEQIQYINKLVLKAVDEIMANSSEPPIIIVQGDHGPGAFAVFGSIDKSNVQDRMGMLNAYYFPDQNYTSLYPSISPVNSFRVILDNFFGEVLGLLPDNHFFSTGTDFALDYSWTVNFTNVNEYLNR